MNERHAYINAMAAAAILEITRMANQARYHIEAQVNYELRSLGQRRRWHKYHQRREK